MKKVLFLINTLRAGGAEKVLVDTVNNLDKSKYQITVQTIFDEGVFKTDLSKNVRYKSIVKNKNKIIKKLLSKFISSFCPPSLVYLFCVRENYDYEIAFLEGLPTKILAHSTNYRAKKYAWVHTDLVNHPDSVAYFKTETNEAEAYRKFDKIVCVSENVAQAFSQKYGEANDQVVTVYNILENEEILNQSMQDAVLPGISKPCFISVGRLTGQKGFDRLLRVHNRLVKENLAHTVIIIGDGELREQLEQYVKDNDLSDSVFLLGFQKNPHKYVSKADCFVCSSYAEGFSTVVSEAVICGTPVISTDVAGSREPYVAPRCSMVVENSEEGLYEAMKQILLGPKLLNVYRGQLAECQKYLKTENLVERFEAEVFGKGIGL